MAVDVLTAEASLDYIVWLLLYPRYCHGHDTKITMGTHLIDHA